MLRFFFFFFVCLGFFVLFYIGIYFAFFPWAHCALAFSWEVCATAISCIIIIIIIIIHLSTGDSLNSHNGMKFTTLDRDFDTYPALNCARRCHGAWWYQWCHTSNLNGDYKKDGKAPYVDGMTWTSWKGNKKSLKFSQMKIRRIWFVKGLHFADLSVFEMNT